MDGVTKKLFASYLGPFLAASSNGLTCSALSAVITQRSMLLPDPYQNKKINEKHQQPYTITYIILSPLVHTRSLKIPAAMASLTKTIASSLCKEFTN